LEPTNARSFIKVTTLQHASSYVFWNSMTHQQGARSCTRELFTFSSCSSWKLFTM